MLWKTFRPFDARPDIGDGMMGIADWQILFSDVSLKDPMISYKYDGLKKSLIALPKAFPEKDFTKYFELLEARWI